MFVFIFSPTIFLLEYTHRAIDDSANIAQGHYCVLKAIETLNEAYVLSSHASSFTSSLALQYPGSSSAGNSFLIICQIIFLLFTIPFFWVWSCGFI